MFLAKALLGLVIIFFIPYLAKKLKLKDKENLNSTTGFGSARFKAFMITVAIVICVVFLLGIILSLFDN